MNCCMGYKEAPRSTRATEHGLGRLSWNFDLAVPRILSTAQAQSVLCAQYRARFVPTAPAKHAVCRAQVKNATGICAY